MSASLVGSEMCIRDSTAASGPRTPPAEPAVVDAAQAQLPAQEERAEALLRASSPTRSEAGQAAPAPQVVLHAAVGDGARAFLAAAAPAGDQELPGALVAISGGRTGWAPTRASPSWSAQGAGGPVHRP
eukprot:5937035-Alexandrium_andersonii.AAC.1